MGSSISDKPQHAARSNSVRRSEFPSSYWCGFWSPFLVFWQRVAARLAERVPLLNKPQKNVFLFPSQTYIRKAYELYIALLLEVIWGKERIMEVYLNVIEFGPGIYGVEAASQYYFGISANRLSKVQAAQLAVVLPNPYRIKPTPMSDYVNKRTLWVVSQMNNLGYNSINYQ